MPLFAQPFDARTVKPNEAFEPVPDGWYVAVIRNSEGKPTKDSESGYLQVEVELIDGEHKGRKIFDILNLWNKSQQAVEIAQRQLSAYCHATGVLVLTDSVQLHGIPIKVKVGTRKDEGFDPRNVIKAVKHVQDLTPSAGNPALAHVPPTSGFTAPQAGPAFGATAAPTAPFGQNPALPPQPAPSSFVQGAPVQATPVNTPPPWGQPASQQPQPTTQQPPWAAPVQAPIAQPLPPQQPMQPPTFAQQPAAGWTPQAAPVQNPASWQGTPSSGPVPPWRR